MNISAFKKRFHSIKNRKFFLLLGIIISIEMLIIIFPNILNSEKTTVVYATEIIKKCKKADYRPSCYDREIPKLMDKMSMEEAFEVTGVVQEMDDEYIYCHVLGHELSAREVKRDPANWRDVLTKCPSGICSNGCLHGGLQEKFSSEELTDEQVESLIPEFSTLCEARAGWNPTRQEKDSCYHALGHLSLYITDADINKTLKICDRIAFKNKNADSRFLCYDGVFMLFYQPLDPEDFALVAGRQPTRENADEFCNQFSGMQKSSCQTESWPLFKEDYKNNPDNLYNFCMKADEEFRWRCFIAGFNMITTVLEYDTEDLQDYCINYNENMKQECFGRVAARFLEAGAKNIDKSMAVCSYAEKYDPQGHCYEEVSNYANYKFQRGSQDYATVCNSLPDKWKNTCLN